MLSSQPVLGRYSTEYIVLYLLGLYYNPSRNVDFLLCAIQTRAVCLPIKRTRGRVAADSTVAGPRDSASVLVRANSNRVGAGNYNRIKSRPLQILENNNWARDFGQTGGGWNKATQLVDSVLAIVWRNEKWENFLFLFWGCKMKFCRGFSYFGKSLKPTN